MLLSIVSKLPVLDVYVVLATPLLFPCCTFSMLYFFHVALFPCCTLFMLHFLHVTLFSCCTLFMLHYFPVALSSCCTFCTLHFFHVALFWCCIFSMLHSFHAALFSCCTFHVNVENYWKWKRPRKHNQSTKNLLKFYFNILLHILSIILKEW